MFTVHVCTFNYKITCLKLPCIILYPYLHFRCEDEVLKTKLQLHMEKDHGIVNYDKLMKRSFKPEIPSKNNKKRKVSNQESRVAAATLASKVILCTETWCYKVKT